MYNLYLFSIRGCERVFFSTGREEHETDCKYRPIPCQYQIHGCKAVFSQKVKYVFECRLFSRFLYFSYTQLVSLKYYFFLVKILWKPKSNWQKKKFSLRSELYVLMLNQILIILLRFPEGLEVALNVNNIHLTRVKHINFLLWI